MRRRLLVLALALTAAFSAGRHATLVAGQAAEPLIGFIGVWDRAEPTLDEAARALGLRVAFWRPEDLTRGGAQSEKASGSALILVLNIRPDEAIPLRDFLRSAKTANPRLAIVSLDKRDSQTDLIKAGLLVEDPKVPDYWRANGSANLRRLLVYAGRQYLGRTGTIEPPVLVPDFGYYDPDREESFETFDAYRAFKQARGRWQEGAPVAALLIQQSFWVTKDTKVVDAEVRALERQGINPVVIFADREGMAVDLLTATTPSLIVEDRHGAMWESRRTLEALDVPYLRPISMLGYTIDEWKRDPAGLASRDVNMFLTLQESWGTIEPIVVGGLVTNISGYHLHEPVPDGIEKFARRARRIIDLRRRPNAEKKIAVIYYNKGLGKDDLMRGSPTGAFLDAPTSLMKLLPRLKSHGYTITGEPATADALIARMKTGARNVAPWAPDDLTTLVTEGDPILVPVAQYKEWFERKLSPANRQAVIKAFGPPPGKIMTVTREGTAYIVIPRLQFGNLLLAPQPERGERVDDTLLHSRDVPPPHHYLAFYWWLDEVFKADAVVHWGTHGSLELLPGKEAGLTRDSWSDIAVGDLPVINLWIMDNVAEATLSRRRSYATLVDHLPPPAMASALAEPLRNVQDDITKFKTLEGGMLKEEFRKRISTAARQERLHETLGLGRTRPFTDAEIARVEDYLQHLAEEQTPLSLHVLGEPMAEGDQPAYLTAILGTPFLDHLSAVMPPPATLVNETARRGWLKARGAEVLASVLLRGEPRPRVWSAALGKDIESARAIRARLLDTDREITGFLHALDGRYVVPGPGPEPIRNPDAAPGGRNLYSLNPEEIPTKPAWALATQLVDELIRMRHPQKVGMDLNGMDTMRDFGVMEGQILYLLGVRPVWDRNNLAVGLELIPREELKRPRVDVFVAMGGQYKENFPTRVELIDKAVRLAAGADEPDNYVRQGTAANARRLEAAGLSPERAAALAPARVFGTKQGNMSGTNILYLIPRSGIWGTDKDVSSVYIDSMSYAYTQGAWGEKVAGLYEGSIQGTQMLVRNWSSNMTSQLSNHHAYEYLGGLSMAVKALTGKEPEAFIADVRNPDGVRMREFNEVLSTSMRTELLNPAWISGMKQHGYAGAGHAAELVKNTFGWAVSRDGAVTDATWKEIYNVYVNDSLHLGMKDWMERDNPHALQEVAATMLEASRKGYWKADAATVSRLAAVYQDSVRRHGDSNGMVSGGNHALAAYVEAHAISPAPGAQSLAAPAGSPLPAPPAGSNGGQPTAAAAPAPAAATVSGQVLAKVGQPSPARPAAPDVFPLLLSATGAAGFGLFLAGFVRREGSL